MSVMMSLSVPPGDGSTILQEYVSVAGIPGEP